MSNRGLASSVTRGFVSYRRDDNQAFRGVVDQLRSDIMARYEATTGKQLDIFLDRESIGWGEDWRQKIHDSVESATIFMPIITMRYFTSQMCMEELLAFHTAADRLGVTDLLMPVVLFGSDQIRETDPRNEVRLIAKLNYKDFEDAWTAGYDSPAWHALIAECVRDLDGAIQRTEDHMAADEHSAAMAASVQSSSETEDEGSILDVSDMTEQIESLPVLMEKSLAAANEVAAAAGEAFEGLSEASPQHARLKMVRGAELLKQPALNLDECGEELQLAIVRLDGDLRGLVRAMSDIDLEEAREQVISLVHSFDFGSELADSEAELEQVISMLKLVSLMNVSIRKSLAPAMRGLRSIQTAIGVINGWKQLVDEL